MKNLGNNQLISWLIMVIMTRSPKGDKALPNVSNGNSDHWWIYYVTNKGTMGELIYTLQTQAGLNSTR